MLSVWLADLYLKSRLLVMQYSLRTMNLVK